MRGLARTGVAIVTIALVLVSMTVVALAQRQVTLSFHVLLQGGEPIAQAWRDLAAEFERLNPDVRVNINFVPGTSGEFLNRLVTQFAAKDPTVDVISIDVIWPASFAMAGWLEPLDRYFTPEARRAYTPGAIQAATIDGKIYAVPLYYDAGVLYYRRDLLQKYGIAVPETWDDLIQQSKRIMEAENDPQLWGFLFQGAKIEALTNSYLEVLWSMGGDVLDERGKVILDSPKAVEALRLLLSMVEPHRITPRWVVEQRTDDTRLVFQDGRVVFLRNWTYAWSLFQGPDSKVRGKTYIGVLPKTAGYDHASTLGGWFLGISAYSRYKEQAWRFVQFLTGERGQKLMATRMNFLPALLTTYNDPEVIATNPHFGPLLPVVLSARARPRVPEYTQLSSIMQTYLNAALAGQMSPEDAVAQMSSEVRRLLGQ